MSNPFKTRDGGATVTVFVPYDCNNHCPFCINKEEYADTSNFSLERILYSIHEIGEFTPRCDFVFSGGEPLANLAGLQQMLDAVPSTHHVFINTTLPVFQDYSEDEVTDFLNSNRDKITCVNVSRHLHKYVEEGNDDMQLLPRGGYLATCSCSHFMPAERFGQMLDEAARDADVSLRQIETRQQAPDHPILRSVPETDYLKFYLFQVV